ncbi:RNA polymerase sigma factor [Amycolatopsis thailandensis]|uniref:RNA polymerase sigma factor n=1 Tax=Amycolatopsis thailandensis TaxID=589330 RepID=UPI001FC9BEF8|nr:RNA polymerase sigma factor [Amycolatopsis thailandensis]
MRRCGRFLPRHQGAEEVCQEVLDKVAAKLPAFEWRSKFGTWLHGVVSNSALSTYRSLKHRPFILRDISQLTYAEIAEELEAPVGTVKSQVHDARQAIQELLG